MVPLTVAVPCVTDCGCGVVIPVPTALKFTVAVPAVRLKVPLVNFKSWYKFKIPVPPEATLKSPPLISRKPVVGIALAAFVAMFNVPEPRTARFTIPVPLTVIVLLLATFMVEVAEAMFARVRVPELTTVVPLAFMVLVCAVAEPIKVPPFTVKVEEVPTVRTPPLPPLETLTVPAVIVRPPFATKVETAVPSLQLMKEVPVFVIKPVTVNVATLVALAPTIRAPLPAVELILAAPATDITAVPVLLAPLARLNRPLPVIFKSLPTEIVGLTVPVTPESWPLEMLRSRPMVSARLPEEATKPTLNPAVLVMFRSRPTVVRLPDKLNPPVCPWHFQVKSEKDWPRPEGVVPVVPVTLQLDPVDQVAVSKAPPGLAWSYIPALPTVTVAPV